MKKLLILLSLFSVNAFATPVNVNTADAQTIASSLNNIGIKKAEAIVKYRSEKGPFKSIEDFDNVSGIGAKTIEKNRADILFSDIPQSSQNAPANATKPATKTEATK